MRLFHCLIFCGRCVYSARIICDHVRYVGGMALSTLNPRKINPGCNWCKTEMQFVPWRINGETEQSGRLCLTRLMNWRRRTCGCSSLDTSEDALLTKAETKHTIKYHWRQQFASHCERESRWSQDSWARWSVAAATDSWQHVSVNIV